MPYKRACVEGCERRLTHGIHEDEAPHSAFCKFCAGAQDQSRIHVLPRHWYEVKSEPKPQSQLSFDDMEE